MTQRERRQQSLIDLKAALTELRNHGPFLKFMDAVAELREVAITDACLFEKAANPNTTFAAIGRIQGMQDIIDLVEAPAEPPPGESS